jgi:uncharacterized phiE125 gp8 family phage protein
MLSPQFSLVRVTAPAASPISLAEVKAQMRVEGTDEDTIIQRLIDAAVAYVDVQGVLGRAMITQTWGEWLPSTPPTSVILSLGPVQSVSAIKYYDLDGALQTATLADFNVFGTPNRITVSPKTGKAWPIAQMRDDAIKIEYVIGYGATSAVVPQTIRHALMMLVAHWYEHRETTQEKQMQDLPYGFMEMMNIERGSWYG